MVPRYFTVAEANAELPKVRQLVERILNARREILELQPQIWPVIEKVVFNGGSKAVSDVTHQIMIIQNAVHTITDMGVEIRDLNSGLVDFPAWRGGQIVLLCWQYDEPAVQFWHDRETGFAGRRPIEDWDS